MLHWTVARPLSDKERELSAELTITTQQQENLAATCEGLVKRAHKAMAARRQAAESGNAPSFPTVATPGGRRSAVALQPASGGGGRSGDAEPTQAQLNSVGGFAWGLMSLV